MLAAVVRAWRVATVTATVAAAVLVLPARSAPPVERLGLVIRRTRAGATSWQLGVDVRTGHKTGGFIAGVGGRFVNGRPVTVSPMVATSSRRWEDSTLQVGDTEWSTCSVGVCHDDRILGTHGLGAVYSDRPGPDQPTHYFVVAYGREVGYEFEGDGWEVVTDRAPLAYRFVDGREGSKAAAHVGLSGVEVSGEYAAPGGRYGSLALAFPPCSVSGTGVVSRGVGQVRLDGGVDPKTFTCPADRNFLADFATRATRWRLHGPVAGETTGADTRLFVLDVPKRLP